MPESKKYTGEEFLKALSEDKLTEPIVLEGMAKLADEDAKSFMFALGTDCAFWAPIPLDIVVNIELMQIVPCKDHTHPFIRLHLKEPPKGYAVAGLLAALARQAAAIGSRSIPCTSYGFSPPYADSIIQPRCPPGTGPRYCGGVLYPCADFNAFCCGSTFCAPGQRCVYHGNYMTCEW